MRNPLSNSIVEGLPKVALGKDLAAVFVEVGGEFAQMLVDAAGLQPTDPLPLQGSGALVAQPGFDAVDLADQQDDPSGDPRMVFSGSAELASDVGEADL